MIAKLKKPTLLSLSKDTLRGKGRRNLRVYRWEWEGDREVIVRGRRGRSERAERGADMFSPTSL